MRAIRLMADNVSAAGATRRSWSKTGYENCRALLDVAGSSCGNARKSSRGFLTGSYRSAADLVEGDWRSGTPRFQEENLERNLRLADEVRSLAEQKGVTAAQLALAWVHSRGDDVVPIPGTKRRRYLEENAGALELQLTDDELRQLDEAFPAGVAAGDRYPDMSTVNR